jgi:dienelactone hydrolase
MKTELITYDDGDTLLEGYLAYDELKSTKQPAVLVAHDWSGRNAFACEKAEMLAKHGYIGFALDMFGKDVSGNTTEEKKELITPFMQDRALLIRRITAAFNVVKGLNRVNESQIAGIGFCFGGLCILDLARSGADVKGVVSFHGLFSPPPDALKAPKITAKVLALHGNDDPMVPPPQVVAFEEEMTKAGADWQVHVYGNTQHAFTNPQANDTTLGTIYNSLAAKRAWKSMENFFQELFLG